MRSLWYQARKSQLTQGGSHQPLISNFQLVRVMAKGRGYSVKHISKQSEAEKWKKCFKKKRLNLEITDKAGTQVTAGRNEAKSGEDMEELSHRPRNKSQGTEHGTPMSQPSSG